MKEALRLALWALDSVLANHKGAPVLPWIEARDAVKEALAQPEQEPVAWHTEDHLTDRSATTYSKDMVYRWECKGWAVPSRNLPRLKGEKE